MNNIKEILKKNNLLVYTVRCIRYYCKSETYEDIFEPSKNRFMIYFKGDAYPNQIIYDINFRHSTMGLFACYMHILCYLYVCERFKFTPSIRIYESYYSDRSDDNVFEYYWLQPAGLETNKVDFACNVVKYNFDHQMWLGERFFSPKEWNNGYCVSDDYLAELVRLRNKYIMYRPEIEMNLNKDADKIFEKDKLVGVHYRGTDYKAGFACHPVALSEEDYYPFIDECISLGYSRFFLATDDAGALRNFVARYGDRIVFYQDTFRSNNNLGVHVQKSEVNGFRLGYEVLRDMYTLSLCDGLICGKSQVSFAARIEKLARDEVYDYQRIIDKGNNADNRENKRKTRKYCKREKKRLSVKWQ